MPNKAGEFDRSDLSVDLSGLRAEVARLSDTLAGFVRERAESATATLKSAAGGARNQMSRSVGDARENALAAAADVQSRVEKNPLTAMMIAVAIGIALTMLTRSRE